MSPRRLRTTVILLGLMSAVGACGAAPSAPNTPDAEAKAAEGKAPAPEQQTPPPASYDEIDADEMWDKQAETACSTGSFSGFVEAFVRSPSVARHYSARQVSIIRPGSWTMVRGAAYGGAPITLMDHRWVTSASATDGAPFERVDLQIEQAGDNRVLVEWRPVEYGAPGPDEEDGEILRQTGPGGALLFTPTDHCWELVEDRIRTD